MSTTVGWPAAIGIPPRPVYCVIEHTRRDHALAKDACRGCFTELGVTLQLGREPDWMGSVFPADEEWRIAFAKFYLGLDLSWAFRKTGERRYQRAWERLVTSWIEQVPIGVESTDTVARRMLNWVYAWSAFADAPGFAGLAPGLDRVLARSLDEQAQWLRARLTARRNHRTLELYALFICALALPELDAEGRLLEFALAQLGDNLTADFRADGVHVEASTHYHLIVLRSFLGVRVNAVRFGIGLPHGFDDRLGAALKFALHCHRPDGQIPALSDSDSAGYAELLALAAEQLQRPDYLYAATRGVRGTAPRVRNVSFPAGGYHVQRSGWGEHGQRFEDERFLIFDCGPVGDGGHGHYDLLSVELAAGGRPLVIDPGRYTYHEGDPNLRRWFKGTRAHNTVCVDGLDQTEYHRGKPKGPIAQGRFLSRTQSPGLDVLWGEAVSPRYDARHRRRVLFAAGEYWLFEDRMSAARAHRYEVRWHLAPDALGEVELAADGGSARAPGLAFACWAQPEVALEVEDGWHAPSYGIKHPAPILSAVIEHAVDATVMTLVCPTAPGAPPPSLAVVAWSDDAVEVEVEGVGLDTSAIDRIGWSADGAAAQWRRTAGVGR